ncbi:hypothetical protein THAOC_01646 [Thalassiosira oceanica]|uniref:Uncharacterized protein n=1 Tax=Thalassiosira oceanica TaxID=159749 RepID=K0TGP0_THAOC|nr:hypothetical protein THAOC_01646 [Thalassiosira oceanica]|eukprot:EJK76580.1 hypothetical protein THAOC_01646 [Thalassiosira oceanica]
MDNEDYAPREILHGASTSTLGTVLLFGTVIFCTSSLAARLWLTGTWSRRSGPAAEDGGGGGAKGRATTRSAPLDASSLPSVYALLVHSTSLGLILLYSYLCENHPPHHHGTKTYDRDEFFFWTVLVVVFAGGQSLRRNIDIRYKDGGPEPVPDRGVEGVDAVHVSAIPLHARRRGLQLHTGHDNLLRLDDGIWELLIFLHDGGLLPPEGHADALEAQLPRGLPMSHAREQLHALLHLSAAHLLLRGGIPDHVRQEGKEPHEVVGEAQARRAGLRHLRRLGRGLAALRGDTRPLPLGRAGHRRDDGDILGMVFSILFGPLEHAPRDGLRAQLPHRVALLQEARGRAGQAAVAGKAPGGGGVGRVNLRLGGGAFPVRQATLQLDQPLFRVRALVDVHLRTQFDAHDEELLDGFPARDREDHARDVPDAAPYLVARKLHSLTLHLRGMLLPDDKAACVRSAVGLFTAVAGCYCAAFALESAGLASLSVLGLASMLCGFLLYQSVVDSTWSSFAASARKDRAAMDGAGDDDAEEDMFVNDYDTVPSRDGQSHVRAGAGGSPARESAYTRFCPPLIGSMSLIMLGVIWNCFATSGSSAIGPLPRICDAHVNEGMWVAIDGCNEASEGMAYRDHRAEIFGTCAPHGNSFIWAWKKSRCRFGHRSEAMVRRVLQGRNVVFIGDSMTRYVYHATMRGLGIPKSGEYDATGPKHADIYNTLWGTTAVNFKWAPLATDQLGALEEVNRKATEEINQADDHPVPDLIFLGGGAWDRLHVYATDEDRRSHSSTLKQLAFEMQRARDEYSAAVVWFIPTTINSQALNTEEKRDHMREEDMEAMRAVYSRNGILSSSSFVIDGPAFTSSRVGESYDGVHYPIQVYSAGAQILFNALDWLLPPGYDEQRMPPRVGKMADPVLGFFMIVLVLIGLVGFDSFLGFSYLSSLFVRNIMPMDLYEESFSALHRKIGVASPIASKSQPPETQMVSRNEKIREGIYGRRNGNISNIVDDEIASLLDKARDDGSFASQPSM